MRLLCLTTFLCLCTVYQIDSSKIEFQASSSTIKPLVTQSLKLTCKLTNTAVVRREVERSVTSLPTGQLVSKELLSESSAASKDSCDLAANPLTQTAENMARILLIVIAKDGSQLATVTPDIAATSLGGASGCQVSGQLAGLTADKGHLELVCPYPGPAQVGSYTCDVTALTSGHSSFVFTETLSIDEEELSTQDLVTHLQNAELEIEDLQKTINNQARIISKQGQAIQQMNTTIDNHAMNHHNQDKPDDELTKIIQQMNATIDNQAKLNEEQTKTIDEQAKTIQLINAKLNTQAEMLTSLLRSQEKLNQSLNDHSLSHQPINDQSLPDQSSKQRPDIFFSAAPMGGYVEPNNSPKYYPPSSNQGKAFDKNTGIFTVPHSGFYHFELHIFSTGTLNAYFVLQQNGMTKMQIRSYGKEGLRESSNSIYLRLKQGDQVRAVAYHRSWVVSGSFSSFTGRLIALL